MPPSRFELDNLLITLELTIGYEFTKPALALQALQASGNGVIIPGSNRPFVEGNLGLAVVGDSVLALILNHRNYLAGRDRGAMSNALQMRASNVFLDGIGRGHNLDDLVVRNPNQPWGPISPKTMTATVEAIIGAVYLDSDLAAARAVIRTLGIFE